VVQGLMPGMEYDRMTCPSRERETLAENEREEGK
jgi:hypothetical protein